MKRLLLYFLLLSTLLMICACDDQVSSVGDGGPRLVAHGGGAIYGYRLTNSKEALDAAYENGFRYIELDFERTSDGVYVLIHDWESMAGRLLLSSKIHTHEEFLQADTFQDLTLLDLDGLLSWLDKHKDVRIITDAKCANVPFLGALSALSEEQKAYFIVQTYSVAEYDAAKNLGFSDIILTLYAMSYNEETILSFADREQPWAITIPEEYLNEGLLSALAEREILTYTHTVNDLSYYEMWREKGLYGIYTDYFVPEHWVD